MMRHRRVSAKPDHQEMASLVKEIILQQMQFFHRAVIDVPGGRQVENDRPVRLDGHHGFSQADPV